MNNNMIADQWLIQSAPEILGGLLNYYRIKLFNLRETPFLYFLLWHLKNWYDSWHDKVAIMYSIKCINIE